MAGSFAALYHNDSHNNNKNKHWHENESSGPESS